MRLIDVLSANYTRFGAGVVDFRVIADLADGSGQQEYGFTLTSWDDLGLSPDVNAWMAAHPEFVVGPYVQPVPVPPSTNAADYKLRPDQFFSMLAIGNLDETVDKVIASMADPIKQKIARAKLNHTPVFERNNEFVVQLSAAAGLTPEQVDALWLQAKAIP